MGIVHPLDIPTSALEEFASDQLGSTCRRLVHKRRGKHALDLTVCGILWFGMDLKGHEEHAQFYHG